MKTLTCLTLCALLAILISAKIGQAAEEGAAPVEPAKPPTVEDLKAQLAEKDRVIANLQKIGEAQATAAAQVMRQNQEVTQQYNTLVEKTKALGAEWEKVKAQIAAANGIRVVLASVTPAYDYPWKRGLEPAEKVVSLNSWIKDFWW